MGNTFADHVLGLAARGLAAGNTSSLQSQKTTENSSNPVSSNPASANSSVGMTYASVVLVMGLGAASVATPANAATDGALAAGGASSTGRVGISLIIPERIDVQGLRDIRLSRDNNGVLGGETGGCIFGHGAGQYSVTAPDVPGSADYELAFSAGSNTSQPLTMGAALQRLEGAGAAGCAKDVKNARIALRLKGAATPDRGQLTLLIAPE